MDKIVIGEIDIDMDKALLESVELKKQIGLLKAVMKDMKDAGKENTAEFIQASAAYKTATSQLRSHENMLAKVIETEKAQSNSIEQLRARLAVVSKKWAELSAEERKNSEIGKSLSKEKLDLTNMLKKEEMATGDARRNVGNYRESLEGLPGPLGQAASGVGRLGKAFKTLLLNPVVLFITAIAGALYGLFKAFKSTDSGATEFQARLKQLGALMDVLRQRAITLIGAFKELFSGNFRKAGEQFKETFVGIGEQMRNAADAAYAYVKALDVLIDSENNYISRSAEIRNAIAKLEFTAQDRTKSTQERKKALEDALALGEQEMEQQRKFAKERLELEAGALAGTMNLRKEAVLAFIQMTDEEQANADESLKTLRENNEEKFKNLEEFYAKFIDADTRYYEENKRNISRYSGFVEQMEKERQEAHEEALRKKAEAAVEAMRKELDAFLEETEELKGRAKQLYQTELPSITDEYYKRRAEGIKADLDNQTAIMETTLFGQLDLEKKAMDEKRAIEIANAKKTGANVELINRKYAIAELKIETVKRDAKLALAASAAEALKELLGEGTKAGKLAASAMVTIESIRAAQGALTGMIETFPGPWGIAAGIIAAAAQIAIGVANVRKIWAVKEEGGGGAETGGTPSAAVPVAGTTPTMVSTQTSIGNGIVSRETVTGQPEISQSQNVLVVDDVTAAQKAESEKVKTATL